MKKTKILIINNGLAGGGIERSSVSLANFWADLGLRITILALYQSEHFFSLHPKINFIEPKFNRNQFGQYTYVIKMIIYTRKQIKQIKPDTILAFSEWTNPFVIIASLGLGIPIYISDRMNPNARLPFVSELFRKIFYKKASGIIAQTNFAKKILEEKTKSHNIRVIPNPVNVIKRINCEIKKRIVTVGRLSPEKGHKYLLKAFEGVTDKSWQLSIVGDGAEKSNLEKMASDLHIQDRVLFHGHLKDFAYQLSEAQIFVLPSLKEGFPNALIEAMALPLACISTNFFSEVNEIIQDGENGLLVAPGDSEALMGALNKLIDSAELRNKLAVNALKIRQRLDFHKIADLYLQTIQYDIAKHS